MTFKTTLNWVIGATVLYGLALPQIKVFGPENFTLLMWISPAVFYIYESLYVWLLSRSNRMKPQKALVVSLIMRGVKFLVVAAMMLLWVVLELPAKGAFLLYTLGYYCLTSFLEGWAAKVYDREQREKKEKNNNNNNNNNNNDSNT